MKNDWTGSETLQAIRNYLRENFSQGCRCPACGKQVKRNKYIFHHSMAELLFIAMKARKNNKTDDHGWFHVENHLVSIGSKIKGVHGKLQYWGMMEQKPNDDPKKKDSGVWRITDQGERFVRGMMSAPRAVYVYNNRIDGWDDKRINIKEALGEEFDYTKMMNEL